MNKKQYTFFSIKPEPELGLSAHEWADEYWDLFGFDFDPGKSKDQVIAWALGGDTEENIQELKNGLDMEHIKYTIFLVDDLDSFFGL